MVHVYWAELETLQKSFDEKVNRLHQSRADKLNAYKMPEDRIRGLGAGLLLEKGLEDYFNMTLPQDQLGRPVIHYGYGEKGKPYLKDYPKTYFSLSHSGHLAVLALSDGEVGIDVQENRGYSEKIAKRFYHNEEQKVLENAVAMAERETLFYRIWTGKEAYIKYTGEGMSRDLRDFYVDMCDQQLISGGQSVARYKSIDLEKEGYYCAIVFDNCLQKIDKIIKINL